MMTAVNTILAVFTALLLTGHAAVVIADEKSAMETGTGSAVLQADVCDLSCRLLRRVQKRFALDVLTGQPVQTVTPGFPDPMTSSGAKAIWIYLEAQEAFLTEYGIVVKTYRISSGAPSTPTPRGAFQIYKKQELRVSGLAVPYRMPNYMSFTRNSAFGLHSLPYLGKSAESSGYWSEALSHIGTPVSHGCVRFLPEEAAEIYEWADIGIRLLGNK